MESWLGTCDLGSTSAPAPQNLGCVLAGSLTCPVPLFPFFMERPWFVVEQGLPRIADGGLGSQFENPG